jgi:hypothetical protein
MPGRHHAIVATQSVDELEYGDSRAGRAAKIRFRNHHTTNDLSERRIVEERGDKDRQKKAYP